MHAGKTTLIRFLSLLALAVALFGCADSNMTLLDEELNTYKYEHEKYRRESLEDLYFEETMRCEDLTTEVLEAQNKIEEKTRELGELNAQLAEIEAQLAEAQKKLAEAKKAAVPPAKPPAKPPEKPPAKQPEKTPPKPPAEK